MAFFNAVVGLHPEPDFFGAFVIHFVGALERFHHVGVALRCRGLQMRIFANSRLRALSAPFIANDAMVTWQADLSDMDTIFTADARHYFVWNGATEDALIGEIRRRGCQAIFCELGFFPQRATTFFDFEGVGAASALFRQQRCPNHQAAQAEAFRTLYLSSLPRRDRDPATPHASRPYVLVPLQMTHDANVLHWSDYRTMDDLVADIAALFPDHLIVARPHPNEPAVELRERPNLVIDRTASLASLIEGAGVVAGINSTTLMEALFWHKRVISLGANLAWNKSCFIAETRDVSTLAAGPILHAAVDRDAINGFISEILLHRQINSYSFLDADALESNVVFRDLLSGFAAG